MTWCGTRHPGSRCGVVGGIGNRGWSPYRKQGGRKSSPGSCGSQLVCSGCQSGVYHLQ